MSEAQPKLRLDVCIAAYTGASLSGVVGLELRDWDTDQPSLWLPEANKEWRSRMLPCLPVIREDCEQRVAKPWSTNTVTNRFSELKSKLGFGPEKVFHSWRHSVANKLENARVPDKEIERVLGHWTGSITLDTYSSEGLSFSVLQEVFKPIRMAKSFPVSAISSTDPAPKVLPVAASV